MMMNPFQGSRVVCLMSSATDAQSFLPEPTVCPVGAPSCAQIADTHVGIYIHFFYVYIYVYIYMYIYIYMYGCTCAICQTPIGRVVTGCAEVNVSVRR